MINISKISIVIPVKNEENYITPLLNYLISVKPEEKEIFIIDGNSTDKTREIINSYSLQYNYIKLIDNPKGFVPFALNKAIQECTGEIIIRLDAHTIYSEDYFLKIIDTFQRTDADIVGGPMRAFGKTAMQKAVAYCTSNSFGVGDSSFHDENAEGYVDSVYLGAWKRSIFSVVGMFDEEMYRNQDDEFHYRAKSKGMKIYLNPAIQSSYFPRSSYKSLFKQYFQYGLFKPLVLKKVKSGMRIRHLIPAGFFLYILLCPLLHYLIGGVTFIPLLLYFVLDLAFSFSNTNELSVRLHSLLVFPMLHFAYGSGFVAGLAHLRPFLFRTK